ncbi:conserved hypothetical protein [Cupriavidus phytorum]|uniref:Uncharacterized protein n=1 Tax=Cupriavidus taiwanensis TaxID=164546 RepID=A0A975XA50_9BURK|nr:conserved hypothetical protein [Cupriavidus taiwanensis]
MPALLPIPVFSCVRGVQFADRDVRLCGRATQEVRWPIHDGMRTISCRKPRQLDAKKGKCTAWVRQVSGSLRNEMAVALAPLYPKSPVPRIRPGAGAKTGCTPST